MVCNRYAQRGIIAQVLPDADIPYMGTLEEANASIATLEQKLREQKDANEKLQDNLEQALKVDATLIQDQARCIIRQFDEITELNARLTKTSEKKKKYRTAMDKMVQLYPSIRQDLVNLREIMHNEHFDDCDVMADKILRDIDLWGGTIL